MPEKSAPKKRKSLGNERPEKKGVDLANGNVELKKGKRGHELVTGMTKDAGKEAILIISTFSPTRPAVIE